MVKLQEVSNEYYEKVTVEDEDFSDDFDEEFDDLEEETLWERIKALQDIVPISQRRFIKNSFSSLYSAGLSSLRFAGKSAWVLSTSAFIVILPLLYELERDDTQAVVPASSPRDLDLQENKTATSI